MMATYDHYAMPVPPGTWNVPAAGATRFSWEYDEGRSRLLDLYQRGKDKQWDAAKRIDWDVPVNPADVMERGDELCPIYGSRQWEKLSRKERDDVNHHVSAWLFSQFLHGEQGALTVAGRIVESVPDMDAKFYAATQAMDEARHLELFGKFMREKIGLYYPVNPDLARLLSDALTDSRWDMPYLGMQVLIEGLALAAFGVYRDVSQNPLVTQLLAYIMQDEARHVAFGRLALRDYYAGLTSAELADREDFVVEGCRLMYNRFVSREVWECLGFDVEECVDFAGRSPMQQVFRKLLFSRIVPCVRDIGLWGPKIQHAYAGLGVLDAADGDLDALMRADEQLAERIDEEKYAAELAARQGEVHEAITDGEKSGSQD
jgi:P-aminobenzoate N-oxygenase AurF